MEDGTETELEDSADAAETETENRAARRSRSPRRAALPSSSSSGAPTSDVRARHAHAWDAAEAARRHQLRDFKRGLDDIHFALFDASRLASRRDRVPYVVDGRYLQDGSIAITVIAEDHDYVIQFRGAEADWLTLCERLCFPPKVPAPHRLRLRKK